MEFRISTSLISDIYLMVLVYMQCSSALSTNQAAGPSNQPEAYFNGSSYIRLQTTINLKKHTAFSFKSCTGGELFSQIHNDNIISLSLIPTTLTLSIAPSNTPKHDTSIPGDYLDNRWHTVQLLYRLGNLTLHIDDEVPRLIANATYHNEVLTNAGLYNDGAVLIVGNHYVGCMMEGPSVVFDNGVGYGHNVVFGPCPIPDNSCIVKQDLTLPSSSGSPSGSSLSRADFCLTEPCMRHGTCINSLTSYTCVCAPRYTGKNCEFDLGNPCEKKQPPVCKNGGICTDDPTGNYRCTCQPGFSGKGCEIEVVIDKLCVPNPCQSGGTCSVSTTTPSSSLATTSLTNAPPNIECACAPGFAGVRCETNINECASGPCRHGGVCIDGPANYTCDCGRTGYAGPHCEKNVNECSRGREEAVCRNGGVCYDTYGGYICECAVGWSGRNCEMPINDCLSHPCRNHGSCEVLASGGFECHCLAGYGGPTCDLESRHGLGQCDNALCGSQAECREVGATPTCVCKPEYTGAYPNCIPSTICQVNPCLNGGICFPWLGSYNCTCPFGFTGSICERPEVCKSDTCRNGGTCVEDVYTTFRCLCPETTVGRYCEKRLSCADEPCVNALSCRDFTSGYYCTCEAGWGGSNCDMNVNDCLLGHCLNGATCIDQIDDFSCQCALGYTGERCHINIDDCIRMPCRNGGTCIDKINDYVCNCTENWMGPTCEKPYDACELKVCHNNASCTTGPNKHDFTCTCLSGFEGSHCDINIDDCIGVTCPAGKNCFDLVDSYECRCPAGLIGDMCNIEVDPCNPNPCANGGLCASANTAVGYTCTCPQAHTGLRCDTPLSSSNSNSHPSVTTLPDITGGGIAMDTCSALGPAICNQGICVNKPNGTATGFQCYCQPGYTGERCDLDFDECLSQPCRNGAVCKNRVNNYECECTPGYAGKDCSININECESMPCMAGSTCIDGINEFSCVCVPGLTGKVCEINIDDCLSSPCLNGATCLDELNTYTCDCTDTGYTGINCQQNIDDCISNPCTHGSLCIDLVRDYRCDCYPGYSGKNCHVDIDECESQPCKYGGLCLERSNVTLYDGLIQESLNVTLPDGFKKEFDYEDAAGYECLCVPGVTGPNCEININECESNPCQYGTCVDRIGSYLCECDEGFEGENCEIDIDECEVYKPCLHGECVDKRANYYCVCDVSYGGKNCSVELTGCVENPCLNNGTCKPYLDNETQHKFNCTCQNGFRGATCEMVSTMSLNGNSLVTVNTTRDEGYDIQFRFKTTLPDGILAVGRGLTFYILELSRGRLNLHSSLLNKWEGVFVGSHLNDSRWQRVFVAINASHLVLSANDEQTIYPITFNENSNGSVTSFPTTYIGGYPNYLRKLTHSQPFLVGCTEDVVINGEWVLPDAAISTNSSSSNPINIQIAPTQTQSASSSTATMSFLQVEVGCLREPQCTPNPCHSGGHCTDRWRNFSCTCERPYLGHICQYTYTAATFGHENITDSLVTVAVTDVAKRAVRSIVDISMFVRTRQLRGQIFYLGSALGGSGSSGSNGGNSNAAASGGGVGLLNESYIAAQLENGELFVRIQFNGTVEAYTVGGVKLNNGYNHLIEVIRNVTLVQVKLNGTEYFRKTISATGTLDAQVLYLGGQPQLRPVRQAENIIKPEIISATGPAAANTQLTTVHFKGIIQDVQISDGSKVMVVEFFPLQADEIVIPMPFGVVTFDNTTVLEGVLSDDSCQINPCHHYGVCVNTWNDYRCECTRGFKGKDCKELEFCKLEHCPANSECRNLEDGYECIANATFDPTSSSSAGGSASTSMTPLQYHFSTTKPINIDSVEVTYRTRSWGTVLFAKYEDTYIAVFVAFDEVVIEGNVWGAGKIERRRFRKGRFDGEWSTIMLKGSKDGTMKGGFKDLVLDDTPNFILPEFDSTNFTTLLTRGTIFVAGSDNQTFDYTDILLQGGSRNASSYVILTDLSGDNMGVSTNTVEFGPDAAQWTSGYKVDIYRNSDMFKGCLGEIRVGPHLLPYFPHSVLYNSSSAPEDYYHLLVSSTSPKDITTGCLLCHERDCYNGGRCISAADTYRCSCPVGYAADDCSIDIDECVGNRCQNGATCVDLVGKYECHCVLGYQGDHCEEEIDECESNPCHHGGTCVDLLGNFRCECPEDYVGKQCEALRLITCDNLPCKEGSTCSNVKNDNYPDANFTCICAPGMVGRLCDLPFCSQQHCENGGVCNVTSGGDIPPRCDCTRGFDGRLCERNIDDCVLATGGSPCQNGGICVDGVNRYDCNCTGTGYTGLLCEMDIDECNQLPTPCGLGVCRNIPGSYLCSDCAPGLCGHFCALEDPCLLQPCLNDGVCTEECREQVNYDCQCKEHWAGKNCSVNGLLKADEANGLNILYIAIPIVAVLLVGVGVALAILVNVARSKRATRGTYSPSAQEFCNPRVELDHVLKPPPEERLI